MARIDDSSVLVNGAQAAYGLGMALAVGRDKPLDQTAMNAHPPAQTNSEHSRVVGVEAQALIPVIHEELQVHRELQQTGGVRVRVEVDEVERLVDTTSTVHHVEVLRVSRNQVVSETRAAWHDGDLTVVPVYAERLVTKRELVLVEEIHLQRQTRTEPGTDRHLLQQERVVVERLQPDGSWAPGLPVDNTPGSEGQTP